MASDAKYHPVSSRKGLKTTEGVAVRINPENNLHQTLEELDFRNTN